MSIRIGNLRANDPRAVQLRITAGGDVGTVDKETTPHSAVRVEAYILTDNVTDAKYLMDSWLTFMSQIDHAAATIIAEGNK